MDLEVFFFVATAELVGRRSVHIRLSTPTARDALDVLYRSHPQLRGTRLLIAVNQQYADPDVELREGDEFAVFTPVSGG